MAEIGDTELGSTQQDLVASIVQETLKQKSILMPTVTNYSSFAIPGSKSVDIPRRNQFAAANKAENTDLTAQELTFSVDNIALSKHKAVFAKLEKKPALQSNVNVQAEIISEMAAELALQLDKDIITELKLVSTAAPDHLLDYANTPTDTLQKQDILEARRLLNVQNVPDDGNRWMLISPDQEKAVLQIAEFIEVEKYGPGAQPLATGELGRVYGFRVLMHTSLSAVDSLFYHMGHVGWASQLTPEFDSDKDLKAVSLEFLLHHIYGVKVLDSGKRGVYFNGTGV